MDYEMDEGELEELSIMDERARRAVSLDADALEEPIARLCRERARVLPTSATVAHAIREMQEAGVAALCVTRAGFLVGLVTESDIVSKVVGTLDDLHERSVTEIMRGAPEVLQAEDRIVFLLNKMLVGGQYHIPIVDRYGRPEYLVSLRDVVEELMMGPFRTSISNVPPDPVRGESPLWGG